jgi:hypothetical protein
MFLYPGLVSEFFSPVGNVRLDHLVPFCAREIEVFT